MAVLRLVVDRRAPLHDFDEPRRVERLVRPRGAPDFLGEGQDGAAVAVRHADERRARFGVERQRLVHHAVRRARAALRAPPGREDERRARGRATATPR